MNGLNYLNNALHWYTFNSFLYCNRSGEGIHGKDCSVLGIERSKNMNGDYDHSVDQSCFSFFFISVPVVLLAVKTRVKLVSVLNWSAVISLDPSAVIYVSSVGYDLRSFC